MTLIVTQVHPDIHIKPAARGKSKVTYVVVPTAEKIGNILEMIPHGPILYLFLASSRYQTAKICHKVFAEGQKYRPRDIVLYDPSGRSEEEVFRRIVEIDPVAIIIGSGNLLYLAEVAEKIGLAKIMQQVSEVLTDVIFVGVGSGGMWFGYIDAARIAMIEPSHGSSSVSQTGLGSIPYHIALHVALPEYSEAWKPVLGLWSIEGKEHIPLHDEQCLFVHGAYYPIKKRLEKLAVFYAKLQEDIATLLQEFRDADEVGPESIHEIQVENLYLATRLKHIQATLLLLKRKREAIERDLLLATHAKKKRQSSRKGLRT